MPAPELPLSELAQRILLRIADRPVELDRTPLRWDEYLGLPAKVRKEGRFKEPIEAVADAVEALSSRHYVWFTSHYLSADHPESFPNTNPTVALVSPEGLAAALRLDPRVGWNQHPHISQLVFDLGPGFRDGFLDRAAVKSELPEFAGVAARNPLFLPVLLLLCLRSWWPRDAMMKVIQRLEEEGRLPERRGRRGGSGITRQGFEKCLKLRARFLPVVVQERRHGRIWVVVKGSFPPLSFTEEGETRLEQEQVRTVLLEKFGVELNPRSGESPTAEG